ncbi:MAG: hypothetical protein HW380_2372 [Magnetococcales bacterium]|nr:hypothetical protein [Magnetococcales bacterium]HIJ82739.1 hypothetical protein [Magnetococcales bacterium]
MLDRLKKHHLGVVIEEDKIPILEKMAGRSFIFDELQGVRVLFVKDQLLGLYQEYILREGRAVKYPLGFHHVCYQVDSMEHMNQIHDFLTKKHLGFRLTFPESSGSLECGMITFYQIRNIGMVEFNILA